MVTCLNLWPSQMEKSPMSPQVVVSIFPSTASLYVTEVIMTISGLTHWGWMTFSLWQNPINSKQSIVSDEIIRFTSLKASEKCPAKLRLITYYDEKTDKQYQFLTNHFKLVAKTIVDIYKSRWQIELFFKWIKQNLKIKKFIGTSENAVMTQIWIAICVYLIISFIKYSSKIPKSMQQILRLLQLNLFDKRDLINMLLGMPIKIPSINPKQKFLFGRS